MSKREDEIGALWEYQTRNGDTYLKGKVNGCPVIIFRNGFKKPGERTPDWRVYEQTQRAEAPAPKASPGPAEPSVNDEDLPF